MTQPRRLDGNKTLMRIYFGESDRVKRQPFSDYIVERARARGMAGCTVMRAITGFGATSIVKTASVLALSTDLPMVAEIVDERSLIDSLLEELDPVMPGCLVTLQEIEVRRYRAPGKLRAELLARRETRPWISWARQGACASTSTRATSCSTSRRTSRSSNTSASKTRPAPR